MLTGSAAEPIGDQYVFFAFSLALLAMSTGMVLRARRRFFPEAPWWTVGFGIVIAGLVNPIPFLLANASIYQTAIIAGQVFLLSGIYAAWLALDRGDQDQVGSALRTIHFRVDGTVRSADPTRSIRPGSALFIAGACWAMAIGCRISLAPAMAALSCLVAWRLWSDASRLRDIGAGLICLALPLLAGVGLFAAYNQVRFGSPFEFGARYVLAGQNMHAMVAAGTFISARNIPVNLVRYLLEAPVLQWRFPFICPRGTAAWGWFGIRVNKDFIMDSVAGMVWAAPVFGLAAVPVWVGWRGHGTHSGSSGDHPVELLQNTERETGIFRWIIVSMLTSSALGLLPSLLVPASTMRYLADATPSLAVLASFGVWIQLRRATPKQRPSRLRALIILTAYSALTGVLLGVAGHYGRFITDNFPGGR